MEIAYLAIINNEDFLFRPFADRYRIYQDRKEMLKWVRENGWDDPYGFGISDKPGQGTICKYGSVDILIVPTKIRTSPAPVASA